MSLNKYGESQKDNQDKIATELSAFSHDDVTVEVKKTVTITSTPVVVD